MFLTFDTVEAFAAKRNSSLSFPYLKENGELLSIAANTGMIIEPRALPLYQAFYAKAPALMACYPQYYRFIVGMTLDLEALGMAGDTSATLCKTISDEKLVDFDTADCRRLETLFMLQSIRTLTPHEMAVKQSVIESFDRFIASPARFTKFNKPFFYELTHFIFFLTDYGRRAIECCNSPYDALIYAGLLSMLDDDMDMLAEVCICLRYIGRAVPQSWHDAVLADMANVDVSYNGMVQSALNPTVDEYHLYFVLNWYQALRGDAVFTKRFNGQTPSFSYVTLKETLLSKISRHVHDAMINGRKSTGGIEAALKDNERAKLAAILGAMPHGPALIENFTNGFITCAG